MFGRDLDDAEAWVADWSAAVSARAEQARQLAARVADLTGAATGGHGLIEVRVDSTGALIALRLDDRVTGWPAARIEHEIMATLRRAQATLTGRVTEIVASTVGVDTETGRAVLTGYERRFPAVPGDGDGERRR
ncbi:YbaB/EbfC family nucleoid-associated protein [Micromonospora sp. WMMD882]|uniref:YbaB/EbfC family nucleoid-associated protein n=1 Tax=Micromonospora sp. WMMD882 TaxID=3015151 RepID=UPI00248B7FF5|nr:YbaB/EbfC family nucleoid-associated protein [Micromonospora sp. WMMD882]WBB82214.1 YbaB/EbfC family nucleoid-associated protein [Micromonospora sp. WMMD882]